MASYSLVIFYSLIGGVFSLIGGVLMLSHKKLAEKLAAYGTPFAAGALLAAVFLDLLKDGLEASSADTVLLATLVGVVGFFFAERFLHWFHHHHQHEGRDPARSLVIVGDTIHNALDGVAIAAGFLISVPTGIVTTIAVATHEIPQEIGDFGLLLSKGMPRLQVLFVNVVSALATTVMAVVTFSVGSEDRLPLGWLIGLSAGFLLYIATSDIIPEIHERAPKQRFWSLQPLLLLIGVIGVGLSIHLAHTYIAPETKPTNIDYPLVLHLKNRYQSWYQPSTCEKEGRPGFIAYDLYGSQAPQEQAAKQGCSALPNCRPEYSIEGDPSPTPCFAVE